MSTRALVESSVALVPGPWRHRDVHAGGIRLHVAEIGEGPLVVLLHGFPQFWWTWRHQLVALADAGFRAVAPDLRGYGASDKPPRGYDPWTLSADVVGLIRALGETHAAVVGHDIGGAVALTLAGRYPERVRRIALLSTAHPNAVREGALRRPLRQSLLSAHALRFQVPWLPERWLVADGARQVGGMLSAWGGPGYPTAEEERRYREAMQILYVPHRAMEYYRWMLRSQLRPDGRRYSREMSRPVPQPTLQLHGDADPVLLPATARATAGYVAGTYNFLPVAGAGHFVHEEKPRLVSGELVQWAKDG